MSVCPIEQPHLLLMGVTLQGTAYDSGDRTHRTAPTDGPASKPLTQGVHSGRAVVAMASAPGRWLDRAAATVAVANFCTSHSRCIGPKQTRHGRDRLNELAMDWASRVMTRRVYTALVLGKAVSAGSVHCRRRRSSTPWPSCSACTSGGAHWPSP